MKKQQRNKKNFSKSIIKKALSLFLLLTVMVSGTFSLQKIKAFTESVDTRVNCNQLEGTNHFSYYPHDENNPEKWWKYGPNGEDYFTMVDTTNTSVVPDPAKVYYTFDFTGKGVEFYGYKDKSYAKVKVILDGDETNAIEFDGYSASRTELMKVYEFKGLENKKHQVKVVATGTKASAATGGNIEIHHAVVQGDAPEATDIQIDQKELNLYAGQKTQLTFTTDPTEAKKPDDFSFTVSNPEVVSVDTNGEVTALKTGTTTIQGHSDWTGIFTNTVQVTVSNEEDFHATILDSGSSYQQKDYDAIKNQKVIKTSLWSWKGDKAISEVGLLTNNKDLKGVNVAISDFTSGNNVIKADHMKASFLKETKAFIGNAGWNSHAKWNQYPLESAKEEFFDIIDTKQTIDMTKNRVQLIWLDFNIPEDSKSGIYKGTVTLSTSNSEFTQKLDYELEVINSSVNKPEDYNFSPDYWTYPFSSAEYYDLEPFSDEHIQILKKHWEQYKAYGGKVITGTLVEEAWDGQTYGKGDIHCPSLIKWKKKTDGTWAYDYTYFDKFVETAKSVGLGDDIVMYSPIPWGNFVYYTDEATNTMKKVAVDPGNKANYRSYWGPFFEAFAKHLDEKGWFEDISLGFDERANMKNSFDVIDEVKNKDGKIFRKQGAYNNIYSGDGVPDRMENMSYNLNELRKDIPKFEKFVSERKAKGLKTTFYTGTEIAPNTFVKSQPVEGYWTMAYSGTLGLDGFLDWAYDAWTADPLNDTTHFNFQPGDCYMVYPSPKDAKEKVTLKSIRSEKYDEGVRDINKLYLMKKNQPSLTKEIDALFAAVPSNYDFQTVVDNPAWWPVGAVGARNSKWITDSAKKQMLNDMATFKEGIKKISKKYAAMNAVDKNELQTVYDKAMKLKTDDYTKNTWDIMQKAMTQAHHVLNNESAVQGDIDAAIISLNDATKALILRASQEEFNAVQEMLKDVKALGYASLQDLIERTEMVINNGISMASKDEIAKLKEELKIALNTTASSEDIHTGITVEGDFNPDAEMKVSELSKDEINTVKITIKDKTFLSKIEIQKIFNINLVMDNSNIQPNGMVSVSIPIDENLMKEKMDIIYIDDEGNLSVLPSEIKDHKIVFQTNHFSHYGIITYKEDMPIKPEEVPKPDLSGPNDGNHLGNTDLGGLNKPNPQTSSNTSVHTADTTNMNAWIVLGLLALGMCAYLAIKRYKKSM